MILNIEESFLSVVSSINKAKHFKFLLADAARLMKVIVQFPT